MKKPNITEGEWFYDVDDLKTVESTKDGGLTICEVDYCGQDSVEELANAKAISAVPDMIDALIDAKQYIENGIEYGYINPPEKGDPAYNTLPRINKALKKSGCE